MLEKHRDDVDVGGVESGVRTAMGTERTRKEIHNAYRYSENPRHRLPEAAFANVPIDGAEAEQKEPHPYDKLNKDHAFVIAGGARISLWGNLRPARQGAPSNISTSGRLS